MTCEEFKQQAPAYALGVLDPAERAACDQHLGQASHEGCQEALQRAAQSVVLLADALPPATPSPAAWAAVENRVRRAAPPRRSALVVWLLAAAAVILIVWLGVDRARLQDRLQAESQKREQCVAQLQRMNSDAELRRAALALLALPGTRLIAMSGQGAAQANVIYHSGQKRAFLMGQNLAAPSGRDYQLWMIRGERKIPAGLLRGGEVVSAVDPALLAEPPDAMAITLEAAGGRPQPEGPIVLVGKI